MESERGGRPSSEMERRGEVNNHTNSGQVPLVQRILFANYSTINNKQTMHFITTMAGSTEKTLGCQLKMFPVKGRTQNKIEITGKNT